MDRLKKTKDSFPEVSGKKKNLRQKLKEHDSDPHKCELCEESFKTASALKSHSNVHSKSKLYNCEICQQGFARKGNMLRHQSEEEQKMANDCEHCGNFVAQKTAYIKHLSSQHKNTIKDIVNKKKGANQKFHICDKCGKSFAYKSTLANHKMVHSRNNKKSKIPEGQPSITSFLRSKSTNTLESKTPVKKPKTSSKMTMITRSAKKTRKSLPANSRKSPPPAKQSRKSLPARKTSTPATQIRKSIFQDEPIESGSIPKRGRPKSKSQTLPVVEIPIQKRGRPKKTPTPAKWNRKSVSVKITKIVLPVRETRRSLPARLTKTPTPDKKKRKSLSSKITKIVTPAKPSRRSLRKSLTKTDTLVEEIKTLPSGKKAKSSTHVQQTLPSLIAKKNRTPISCPDEVIFVCSKKPKTLASAIGTKTQIPPIDSKTAKSKKKTKAPVSTKNIKASAPPKVSIYQKLPKPVLQNKAVGAQNKSARASKIAKTPMVVKRCKISMKRIPHDEMSPDSSLRTTVSTKTSPLQLADSVTKTPVSLVKSCLLGFGNDHKTPKITKNSTTKTSNLTNCPKTPISKTPKVMNHTKTPSAKTPATSKWPKTPKVLNHPKTPTTSKPTKKFVLASKSNKKSKINIELKNPFLQKVINKTQSRKSEPISRTNINHMIKNPRTIKDMRLNNEILSDFHKDHSDDMFDNVKVPGFVSRLNLLDSPNSSSPLIKTKSKTPLAALVNNFDGWSADTPGYLKAVEDQGITPKLASDSDFGHLAFVQRGVKNRRVPAVKRKSLFPQPRSRSMDSYIAELEPALKKFRSDPQEDPEDDEIEDYFEEEKENDAQGTM